jgi:hypothetical protein
MSDPTIKICIDRALTFPDQLAAAQRATAENPANAPVLPPLSLPPGVPLPASLPLLTGKLWKPGRTLRVRFLDGDPAVQTRLQPFAHVWSKHANVKFVFGDDANAEIRISFRQQGSWSYVGTDALSIPRGEATMNFGWLTPESDDDEFSRVVTHEFGHALGAVHEHQNPAAEIPWDKPTVYDYYAGAPNFWTKEQVEINLFQRYDAQQSQFSQFDPKSIMLYPIPEEFTIGDFSVGWNRVLSDTDKSFIGKIYPLEPKEPGAIVVGDPPLATSIGKFGEVDTFTLQIKTAGRYVIETTGDQDLVMNVFGPNDGTRLVGSDDDSGAGLNPRLVQHLRTGKYLVRVRHYSAQKSGAYQIQARKERAR